MNNSIKFMLGVGLSALLLVGCHSVNSDQGDEQVLSVAPVENGDGSVVVGEGVGQETGFYLGQSYSVSSPANQKYYFDLNRSTVHKEYMASLEAQAKYLIAHPHARVRLEGNTDEQGSREYNIALGERRANSIAKALELLGVSNDQIVVVSYGEEQPEGVGHDEMAYRLNRRTDLVFETKG